jgi:hypothetical protein
MYKILFIIHINEYKLKGDVNMKNKINDEFIYYDELKEQTIKEFHRAIVQGLINKYGAGTMKEVLRRINSQNGRVDE